MRKSLLLAGILSAFAAAGCATTPPVTGPSTRESAPAAEMQHVKRQPDAPVMTKGPKLRVAVVLFQDKSAYGRGKLGGAVQDILTTELARTDKFIMVTRQDLNLLLDEQDLAKSGIVKAGTGPKSGEVLGVNAIVTGVISQFGVKQKSATYLVGASKTQTAEATVDVRVVDATTGRIIYAESGTGVHESSSTEVLGIGGRTGYDETMEGKAFRAAISKFIDNLIQKMESIEWTGKIASVDGGEVTVNAGKKTGLRIGDRLGAYGEGKEVIDPDTKVSLGRRPGARKGEIEIVEFFGEDASIGKVVRGTGFAVNDIVRFGK
ncbi:MAG: curli polymers formation-like protein [Deltaproteobacteria bacterium]|nr:curli polymers formation-like protein [Deltaproteobacteria bacterium]